MRKIGGLLAASLFVLSCVYLVLSYYVSSLASNPLSFIALIYIICCIPGAIIASVSKRSDMTWLAGLGLTFTIALFILYSMIYAFDVSNLLIIQFASTFSYLVMLVSYVSIMCHIENTNVSVSITKAISVLLAMIFAIIRIWGFWGSRSLNVLGVYQMDSMGLAVVLIASIVFGILALILSVTFSGEEKVESDVVNLGRIDIPQVIGGNVNSVNPSAVNVNNNVPMNNSVINNSFNNANTTYQPNVSTNQVVNEPVANDLSQIINPNPNLTNEIPVMAQPTEYVAPTMNTNPNTRVAVPSFDTDFNNSNGNQSNIVNIPLTFMNDSYGSLNNQPNINNNVNNQPFVNNNVGGYNPNVSNVPPVVNINQNMGMTNQPYNPNNIQNR
ncbi:MAG: hypothetical protein IJ574_03750 [Bacilli bacterium]|nr:hypothetical protein [Bacilli bacterium]